MDGNEVVRLLGALRSLDVLQRIAVTLVPLIFAITVHEVAHGWVARVRGDRTAEMLGRLTLNPVKHIDPIGTLLIPGVLLLLGGFIFGYAKPVPVTVENLKGRRRDMAVVGVAGPAVNLVMAGIWALAMAVAQPVHALMPIAGQFLFFAGVAGVLVNTVLALLNLLPIPPLDGGRVVSALLPGRLSWQYERIEPYGLFIVLGILVLEMNGVISVLFPAVIMVAGLYYGLVL